MSETNYIKVGKLIATRGLKGEVLMKHGLERKLVKKQVECIFVETSSNTFLPYFVKHLTAKSPEEAYLQLEGVDTIEAARLLLKKEAWLTEEAFKSLRNKKAIISFLGYQVSNNGVLLGEVVEVIRQPMQVLCKIMMEGKEVYIPLHEDTLKSVDNNKEMLNVSLPDGLLDIYLDK